jgi:multiple sugar transport system permease protein
MNRRVGYILLIPVSLLLLLQLTGIVNVLWLSLTDSNIIKSKFVGLANYIELFTDPKFGALFINSLLYSGIMVVLNPLIGLVVALTIFDVNKGLRNATLFATYLPAFASGIIISSVWRWIYAYPSGLANWFLSLVGIQPVIWMADRWIAISGVMLNVCITSSGGVVLFLTAACLAIPKELFDAARVDGANAWQVRRRIVVPMILPMLSLCMLTALIASWQIWETIYMMSPVQDANNLMYDMYFTAFRFGRYGMGAAKAVVLTAIIVVLTLAKRRLEER